MTKDQNDVDCAKARRLEKMIRDAEAATPEENDAAERRLWDRVANMPPIETELLIVPGPDGDKKD